MEEINELKAEIERFITEWAGTYFGQSIKNRYENAEYPDGSYNIDTLKDIAEDIRNH